MTINFKISNKNMMYIVHRAYITQQTQKHQGTHKAKTRGEVRGGGKKPWKQKGTGRARAGSIRSPLWRGGGAIFGPTTRNHHAKINKKEKQLALKGILNNKSKNIKIVKSFVESFTKPSTKLMLEKLKEWQIYQQEKALIIVKVKNQNLYLSIRNLTNIDILAANNLNISSILAHKKIIISDDAITTIQEVYNA